MTSLCAVHERRAHACRLTPDRALETFDDAVGFLRERGLLTRTADSALPSLYEACHEDPYRPGRGGFAQWPATKWPWFGRLAERPDTYRLGVHRGKNLLVTGEVAALLDPICRDEIDRMRRADADWALVLDHLAAAGPSLPEDLRTELGLQPRELKAILSPLARCGAVVTTSLVVETTGGGHVHSSEYARWDQVFEETGGEPRLDALVVAGVRAAVVAPERELARWFSWPWRWDDGLIDRLVASGALERPEEGWVTAPRSGSG